MKQQLHPKLEESPLFTRISLNKDWKVVLRHPVCILMARHKDQQFIDFRKLNLSWRKQTRVC